MQISHGFLVPHLSPVTPTLGGAQRLLKEVVSCNDCNVNLNLGNLYIQRKEFPRPPTHPSFTLQRFELCNMYCITEMKHLLLCLKHSVCDCVDADGPDFTQFKEGVAKVTSKISNVASNVLETFQVRLTSKE